MDEQERRANIEAQRKYGMARMQHGLEQAEPLLRLGRAIADPTRVRILALLSSQSMYGQELAEALGVATPTISHHIALLKAAGLIRIERENNYHHCYLDEKGFEQAGKMLTIEHLQTLSLALRLNRTSLTEPTEEQDREMTRAAYFEGNKLTSIPTGSHARRFVLEKIAESFEWGRVYDEKEVNAILKEMYPETATLRRELIEQKFLMREHGRYWLTRPRNVEA
jgi:biotin operon repressor